LNQEAEAHTYNSSWQGGRNQEDIGLNLAPGK
jgi:hypothetical protein